MPKHVIAIIIAITDKAQTAWRLGLSNILRVMVYRLGVKTGLNPVKRLIATAPTGPFFYRPTTLKNLPAREGWWAYAEAFGQKLTALDDTPPNWHQHVFSQKTVVADEPWWQIPDFDPEIGDIKAIWESSRFDWVLALSQHAANGNRAALIRLNTWLSDWLQHNPPYLGVNWKCGQEASIRVMHLAMAAVILDQATHSPSALLQLITLHLQRIAPTLNYAMAQDNNHGTSEAAALFIGGSWLRLCAQPAGQRWEKLGRHWLENRVARLVERDGSFSQHSVNYHRVMLDTLSIAQCWRQQQNLPEFSARFYQRANAATQWLYSLTNTQTGDAPNLGANDGARLLPLTDADYRDHRPSIQLAAALFQQRLAYSQLGFWHTPLQWLNVMLPTQTLPLPQSQQFDDGGYAVLRNANAMALLRYPRFRFRPSQCDVLHVDFWVGADNILRDAGTFSYNSAPDDQDYFPSIAAHNSVQFDGYDAMPRISRFLLGRWPKAVNVTWQVTAQNTAASAAYSHWRGAYHRRELTLSDNRLCVHDHLNGFAQQAILRWRLQPGDWRNDNGVWCLGRYRLTVESDVPIAEQRIVDGSESRYYLQRQTLPVLEITLQQPGTITTVVTF